MNKKLPRHIKESNINWVDSDDLVSVTLYQAKYINQIKRLAEAHPNEVRIIAESKDGVVAHLEKKYLRVNFSEPSKRVMSEEQRKAASERMKRLKESQMAKKEKLE